MKPNACQIDIYAMPTHWKVKRGGHDVLKRKLPQKVRGEPAENEVKMATEALNRVREQLEVEHYRPGDYSVIVNFQSKEAVALTKRKSVRPTNLMQAFKLACFEFDLVEARLDLD